MPPPTPPSIYTYSSRWHALRLPIWLGLAVVVLVVLHIYAMDLFHSHDHLPKEHPERVRWYFVSVFDLGEEESLGTYFSAVLLLFIGRIAWGRAKELARRQEVWATWWILIAIVFHVLSLEEVVNLHRTLEEWYDRNDYEGGPAMREVLLWISIFVGAALVPWLYRVRWRFAGIAVLAGVMYLWGALGLDQWRGDEVFPEYEDRYPWVAFEEALEMLAPILFLHGLLAYLAKDPKGIVEERTEVVE